MTPKPFLLAAFAGLFALSSALPSARAADSGTGTLRVVHGIPGRDVSHTLDPALPVDVLVNDKTCLVKGVTFGTVTSPFTLAAGPINVKISLANTLKPCGNPAVIDVSTVVFAGDEAAIVAALSATGSPIGYVEQLDFSALQKGKARLIVVHAAKAPAVDVGLNGKVAIAGVQPGTEKSAVVASGVTDSITVLPAGGNKPVIGPVDLRVDSRTTYLIFAVGSVTSGSIGLITAAVRNVF